MQSIEEMISSEFESLFLLDSNKFCCDCRTSDPQWGCVTHGIFLCLQCAGAHRNMGSQISLVRSIKMDTWDDYQLRAMKLGGNQKFLSFLEDYHLDSFDISEKYKTTAAEFYRKRLRALASDSPFDEDPPRPEEAAVVFTPGCPNPPSLEKKNKVKEAFVKLGQEIKKGAQDFNNKPKVVQMREKTKEFFGKVNEKCLEVVQKTKESKAFKKMKEGSQSAFEKMKNSGKNALAKMKIKKKPDGNEVE